jgi:hypothetical protein
VYPRSDAGGPGEKRSWNAFRETTLYRVSPSVSGRACPVPMPLAIPLGPLGAGLTSMKRMAWINAPSVPCFAVMAGSKGWRTTTIQSEDGTWTPLTVGHVGGTPNERLSQGVVGNEEGPGLLIPVPEVS